MLRGWEGSGSSSGTHVSGSVKKFARKWEKIGTYIESGFVERRLVWTLVG